MKVYVGDDLIYRPGFGDDLPTQATIKAMTVTEIARDKYGEDVHEVDYSLVQDNKVLFILNDNHWCYSDQVDKLIPKEKTVLKNEAALMSAIDSMPEAVVKYMVKEIARQWFLDGDVVALKNLGADEIGEVTNILTSTEHLSSLRDLEG